MKWPVKEIKGIEVTPGYFFELLEHITLDKYEDWRGMVLFTLGFLPCGVLTLFIATPAAWLLNPPWTK